MENYDDYLKQVAEINSVSNVTLSFLNYIEINKDLIQFYGEAV